MKEPFNLSLGEIAELTDAQLADIYFRPERSRAPVVGKPYWEVYRATWEGRGLTPEQIEAKWEKDFPGRKK